MKIKNIIFIFLLLSLIGCGKVGPLALPEDKLDKSVITYPCNEECIEKFEKEKERQKKIIIQFN